MAMQKHRAASICKSNSSLPEESQSDVGRWAVKLLLCSLPLSYYLVTYTISHGLPMLGRLLKAKTKLYLHLSALDVIQELHTLCSFTFYLAFVLFTKRDILSHCTPQTVWWLSESINYVPGNISSQGLPDPSVLPGGQAETVPLYVSGQVYKAWYSNIVHRCKLTDIEQD